MAAGIIIEDGGFRLEQCEMASLFWDLYGRHKVAHKDGTTSTEWKIIGYGMPIDVCINKIILCRVKARHPEILTFKQFFEDYKQERKLVIESFQLQTLNLTKDLINIQNEIKQKEKE